MRIAAILAFAALLAPGLALADPCGAETRNRIVITGYATGQTAIPADQIQRLEGFTAAAKDRSGICITAQVDAQGSDAANERVARGRAEAVRRFLLDRGARAEAIEMRMEDESFTLFGLLPEDIASNRRVMVTHN